MVFPNIKLYQILLIFYIGGYKMIQKLCGSILNLLIRASLSFILNQKASEAGGDNMIVGSTIKARDMIRKWEKRTDVLSPVT